MAVPPSADLPRVCGSADFSAFVERVKRESQVSIVANVKSLTANGGGPGVEPLPEYSFKFRCQRSNSDFLITAREMLEQFLLNHNIHVYPSPTAHTHKRGDSFAEAFPHFDSKILSTARIRGESLCLSYHGIIDLSTPDSAELVRADREGDRRLRLANSSPDVKALFNSPSYIYDLEEQEDSQANLVPGGASVDYWTPLPPIVRFTFLLFPPSTDALPRVREFLPAQKILRMH
jgi:hypothetical protein